MVDLDFDEIDRAVASAGGPKPADDTAVTVKTTPKSEPVAEPAKGEPEPKADVPASPATRRSSGRFMDMVHSSSDMRPSTVPPRPTEVPVPEREPVVEEPKPSSDMPDPLDFHGFNMEDSPVASEATDEAKPLDTPFLPDAKVEKRPLGAFSSFEPTPKEETETTASEVPAEPETPLLEEPEEAPKLEAGDEEPTPELSAAEPITEPEPPVVPQITQQYKEQAPSDDQPSGAIFDTESYHQALTHPAKKKSGALVVVWILTLILVGGGAGAAIYFFALPLL